MDLFDLSGQVAIVTGSTKGIGRACAEALAACGARVTVSSRSAQDCRRVSDELQERFGEGTALGVACDVSRPEQVDHLVEATARRFGRIDCVMAHAASEMDTTAWIEKIDDDRLATALTSNVVSTARLVKRVIPHMRAAGGSIIITTSVAGLVPMEDRLTYGVTKAALVQLMKVLAVQLGPLNIRVNAIAPGIIASRGEEEGLWADAELRQAALGPTPLGRVGRSEEIAGAVVWLASTSGAFTTGQTIAIDGGQVLKGAEGVRAMHDILRRRRSGPAAQT
jgi:NAD(P)-dependent dehydrogenase (short-subunit alcohol dehydrogenase family)